MCRCWLLRRHWLMVCLGLSGTQTLGCIERAGHPVSGRLARATPGKERVAGRGLKIQNSTSGGAQHEDRGPSRVGIYNNLQSVLKIQRSETINHYLVYEYMCTIRAMLLSGACLLSDRPGKLTDLRTNLSSVNFGWSY